MRKSIRTAVLMILLAFSLAVTGQVCQAKTRDVTKGFTGKKQVQKLLKAYESQLNRFGLKGTVTLDFSKAKDRNKILRWMINDQVISYRGDVSVDQYSKYLFGRPSKDVKQLTNEGDSTDTFLKPQKYYKISSSKYLVKGTIYRGEWDWETDKLENVHKYGSFRLYLKKMPKSHFGYVMQKITLTKT